MERQKFIAYLTALVVGGASVLFSATEVRAQQGNSQDDAAWAAAVKGKEQKILLTQTLFSPDERCSTRDVRPGQVYEWQVFATVPEVSLLPVTVTLHPQLPQGTRYAREQPPAEGFSYRLGKAGEYVVMKTQIVFDMSSTNRVVPLQVVSSLPANPFSVVVASRWNEGIEMVAQKVKDGRTPELGEALEVYVSARGKRVAIEETRDFRSFTELYRNSEQGESFALRFPLQGLEEKAFYRVRAVGQ